MPDLFEQIEMPGFSPAYDSKTKYGYTNPHYKRNLKELLNKTSEGEGHIVRTPESNMVVRVFKKRLEGLERQDVLRICKKLYTYYMVKLKA